MRRKLTFIDEAKIFVQAGKGGDGVVGFLRLKFIPKGGPDGGDGGRGGDVILVGSSQLGTLQDFQYRRHFRAKSGGHGAGSEKAGAAGVNLEVLVPLGTIVLDTESNKQLGEITENGQQIVIAKGGKGGLGNVHFKTSTNQTPRKATPGEATEGKWIRLELRLLADVGLVGPPNAGKSTLLSTLTAARPKVAAYPFTTLIPHLGVLSFGSQTCTLADIPGLIEGAHEGVGLGFEFLRHIERTRLLLYVVPVDPGFPLAAYEHYRKTLAEIRAYEDKISQRASLVVLNKVDLIDEKELSENVREFSKKKIKTIAISAKDKIGLQELKKALHERL